MGSDGPVKVAQWETRGKSCGRCQRLEVTLTNVCWLTVLLSPKCTYTNAPYQRLTPSATQTTISFDIMGYVVVCPYVRDDPSIKILTGKTGSYGSGTLLNPLTLIIDIRLDIPPSTAAITLKRQLYRHQSTSKTSWNLLGLSSCWNYWFTTPRTRTIQTILLWILVGAWSCWYRLVGTAKWQGGLWCVTDALGLFQFDALISAMDNSQWPVWSQRWRVFRTDWKLQFLPRMVARFVESKADFKTPTYKHI